MKKIAIPLIALTLCLFSALPASAKNADVSGVWTIKLFIPQMTIYTVSDYYIFTDGSWQTIETEETEGPQSLEEWLGFVTQNPDGSFSGSVSGGTGIFRHVFIADSATIIGRVSGNSVTFNVVGSYDYVYDETSIPEYTYKIVAKSNSTESFSGVISGNSITGSLSGSGSMINNFTYIPPDGNDYNSCMSRENITASYAGTFIVTGLLADNPSPQLSPPDPSGNSQLGAPLDQAKSAGDPINSVTGNMHIITPDLTIPAPGLNLSFIRTYNNQAGQTAGPLGYGWTHNYNVYLTQNTATGLTSIRDEQAKEYLFADNGDSTFISQRGEYSALTKNSNGFVWTKKDGKAYLFDLTGRFTQIKDRNNNTVNLSYDNQNHLTVVTDPVGRQVSLSYDAEGRIGTLTDPAGRIVTYNYDSQGNLITVIDPLGHTTIYEYDSNHNITKKIDPLGKAIYFTYDNLNRCTSSRGEDNLDYTGLSFDPANKQTTITDSKGNVTTQYYNDDLLITRIINAQGNESTSAWDTNLNRISHTDELGRTTNMSYDVKGNLSSVTDPAGNLTLFTYEPNFSLLQSSTDALGNTTTYARDSYGNPTNVTDALGNSMYCTYNSAGQVTSIQNVLGNTTYLFYDSHGNLTQTKDAQGNVTTLSYDTVGNLVQSKDSKGNATNFAYDNLNELTQVTYADGTSTSYAYDALGNRTSVTDADNNTTDYTYDQVHKLTATKNPLGYEVSNSYDTEENLVSVTDQNGKQTIYEYDSLNRLISKTDALNNKVEYQYDAVGNRIAQTDAKGQTTGFQYDSLNRLTKIIYPTSQISYAYDSLGRRTSMTDALGATSYTYDKLSRLTKVDGSGGALVYTYDKLGNRLSLTDPDGKTTRYTYDSLNRLASVTDPLGKVTNYTYDSVGNLTSLLYPNSTKETYLYDNMNRLVNMTQQRTSKPYTTLSGFTYTYDKLGRKIKAELSDKSYITYSYDASGALLKETNFHSHSPYSIAYEYDPCGNRTRMLKDGLEYSYSYNSVNQMVEEDVHSKTSHTAKITVTGKVSDPSGVKKVTVNARKASLDQGVFTCAGIGLKQGANTISVKATDSLGNKTTKLVHVTYDPVKPTIYTYDFNGNLIRKKNSSQTINLTYDERNMLIHYTAPGLSQTYQYDGQGRRVSVSTNSSTTNYIYDGMNVILERNSRGVTTASYSRNPNSPGGIGGIISRLSGSNSQYYQYDALGSVVNLTNSQSSIIQSYSYDAFGNVTTKSGSSNNSRQFLTKEADASGLIYFGARYYDPTIGRFITQDPMGMVDGSNLYAYCHNNPVNWVDPWGLCEDEEKERKRNAVSIIESSLRRGRDDRHLPIKPPSNGTPEIPTGWDSWITLIGRYRGWW